MALQVFGNVPSVQFRAAVDGLAVSLIFGILVSTLLTLVVIPVLYYALYRRRLEPADQ